MAKKPLNEQLRLWRTVNRVSQEAIALQLGIQQSQVSRFELYGVATPDVREKIRAVVAAQ